MTLNHYNNLIINDTEGYLEETLFYYPRNQPFWSTTMDLLSDYSLFVRSRVGYTIFMGFFTHISHKIDSDLYFTLQMAHFSICTFGSVLIYKILGFYILNQKDRLKYTIILSLLPLYFQYSTYIIRDNLVGLGYYYIVYLLHKRLSPIVLIKFLITMLALTLLRTESGFVCILFFPVFFLVNKNNKLNRYQLAGIISLMSIIGVGFLVVQENLEAITKVYTDNHDAYFTDSNGGTIDLITQVPIIGNFFGLIFGTLQPMPCWARMFSYYMPGMEDSEHLYNIMTFPYVFTVAFTTYIVVYMLYLVFDKRIRNHCHYGNLKYILVPALIFLLLQAKIIDPRRMMGGYIVLFLIWAIVHSQVPDYFNVKVKKTFWIVFFIAQIVGIIRYI